MDLDRRTLMGLGAVVAVTGSASAQTLPEPQTMRLWPHQPPGGAHVTVSESVSENRGAHPELANRVFDHVRNPTITFYRPAAPNGAAVLIAPGGGYTRVWYDKEGDDFGRWLAREGFLAAAITYRLPQDGWAAGYDTPLQDGQRALKLLRREAPHAKLFGMGFSAGGYLVAALGLRGAETFYPRVDAADDLDAKLDGVAPIYPVLDTLDADKPHDPFTALHPRVTANAPPMFFAHAADDPRVPAANTVRMHEALRAAGVASELHVFEKGGHGFAMRTPPGDRWPGLFLSWAQERRQA